MPKFRVYAAVVGSKYLGEFDAPSQAAAEKMAAESDAAGIRLCHQCSAECEDAEIDIEQMTSERVTPARKKRAPTP